MRHQAGGDCGAAIIMGLFDALKISRLTLLRGGVRTASPESDRAARDGRTVALYYAPICRTARLGKLPRGPTFWPIASLQVR